MTAASQATNEVGDKPAQETILISYVGSDLMWAEWIKEQLERVGSTVEAVEWDGGPDTDPLSTLRRTQEHYSQCVAILSGAYLQAVVPDEGLRTATAAWAAANPRALTPVLVSRSQLPPRFWQLGPVDLHEITDEREARRRLLTRILDRNKAIAGTDNESEPMTRFPGRRPPVWSSRLPARNPYFTGRDGMLRDLRRRLTADVTALLPHSLQGMSGVGKTQLAIEYAHRFAADYDIVRWIPADEPAQAREALADLALRLDLAGPGAETGELIRAALDALRMGQPYRRWLLIFDNAESPEHLQPMLLDGPGHTLITSRDRSWDRRADVLDVDVYSRPESADFLLRRVPSLSSREADRLAEELGDLPLALEHVAAWLATTRMTADDYLSMLQKQATDLLSTGRLPGYPKSVAVTWTISMNRLREQVPAAAQLLEICAFIGPHPVPLRLFTDAPAGALPEPLGLVIQSRPSQMELLNAIGTFSMARVGEGPDHEPYLQQHRLVQAVVRDMVSAASKKAYPAFVHKMLAAADPGEPTQPRHWPRYASLLPHMLTSGAVTDAAPDVHRLVLNQARALLVRGEYQACLNLTVDAAQAWAAQLDQVDPDMLAARREQANALRGLARFDESLEVDRNSYAVAKSSLGPDHPQTVRAASGLAVAYRRLGNFQAARELDDHALDVVIRTCGRGDQEALRNAHNVAVNYRLAGDFQAALEIDRYNAGAYARQTGPDSLLTLFARNNVARDLRECGQYYESLTLEEDICARYRELFGEEVPDTLRAMKNLAVSRHKAGRYQEACELAEDVLDRHRRRYGDLHPETLAAATNLANDHRCLGQYASGVGLAEQAVRGYRGIFGYDHPFTASATANLAVLIRLTDDAVAARALNEETLVRLRRVFGDDHRYTLSCAVNLASDLAALGEYEAARERGQDALARLRRVSGEDHPYTLSCAVNLALDARSLGERARFRDLFADTMSRYQRTLGASHPEVVAAAARERANCDIEPPPV